MRFSPTAALRNIRWLSASPRQNLKSIALATAFAALVVAGTMTFRKFTMEAMMADWYASKGQHSEFGYGLVWRTGYRFMVEQRLAPDCVVLGAHRNRNGAYEEIAERVMVYPRKCNRSRE
jgi:hypothetical protein